MKTEVLLKFTDTANANSLTFEVSGDGDTATAYVHCSEKIVGIARHFWGDSVGADKVSNLFARLSSHNTPFAVGSVAVETETRGAYRSSDPSCSYEGDEVVTKAVYCPFETDVVGFIESLEGLMSLDDDETSKKCVHVIVLHIVCVLISMEGHDVL